MKVTEEYREDFRSLSERDREERKRGRESISVSWQSTREIGTEVGKKRFWK